MFSNIVLTKAHYQKNGLENDYYESKYTNNGVVTDFGYKRFHDHNENTLTEIYVKKTRDNDNNIIEDIAAKSIDKSNWEIRDRVNNCRYTQNYYIHRFKVRWNELMNFIR